MDVLTYWLPNIDWDQFMQGDLPDDAWGFFRRVVQLSHAQVHWAEAAKARSREPLGRPLYPESAYMRQKRTQQKKSEIEELVNHQHRAAYLASEQLAQMSHLQTVVADQGAAQKLYSTMRYFCTEDYVHGRFDVLAFDRFNAAEDLAGEIAAVVERWASRRQ